jgi:aerobic-type carbon monoxide dehydrogenase small subunit (CoxS/CutS family)
MVALTINGRSHQLTSEPDTPLLYVLRDELQVNAAKYGCGLGQCGACTVLVDGEAVLSCVVPVMLLDGRQVTTVEGLGTVDAPGPMQQAFIEEQAAQCGYCTSGMLISAAALLRRDADPDEAAIRAGMARNLCRCGTHPRVMRAIVRVAARSRP